MNVQILDGLPQPFTLYRTSGAGVIQRARDLVVRIGGAVALQGTASAETQPNWARELAIAGQTNSGVVPIGAKVTPGAAIGELRRRSGLTWDQLARLFGVARRSVHFWMSGKPLNAVNEERLGRMLAVVRHVDRGNAQATRAALLTALSDGTTPFELLAKDHFDEVKEQLGSGSQLSMPAQQRLSPAARAARMPPPPEERVGALQDTVHREVGKSRVARPVRATRKR